LFRGTSHASDTEIAATELEEERLALAAPNLTHDVDADPGRASRQDADRLPSHAS